ncbi:MAG TPA: cytidine deaminase [Polyangiales bacterium]|nr:cytidine deaminase [Polyangiales bacterium]
MSIDWQRLRKAAEQAQARAYAPYSRFQVGAALETDDGRISSGCNVENASYGLCICAERNAVFAAVASGARTFRALVVTSSASAPVTPCGACRQVLAEFRPSFEVRCYGNDGTELAYSVDELLPHAFSDRDLTP